MLATRKKIVDAEHVDAILDQSIAQVGAKEARAARHKRLTVGVVVFHETILVGCLYLLICKVGMLNENKK
jgi:hypothetical protein